MESKLGSIEEGKIADLVIVDLMKPHLTPIHNIVSHIVYAASGSDVSTTIIDGKIVMQDRKLVTLNEDEILKNAQKVSEDLLKR